jgi:hypothetical protein
MWGVYYFFIYISVIWCIFVGGTEAANQIRENLNDEYNNRDAVFIGVNF